jgi:uncharacterized protein YlxW (UPF0749 family)
MSSRRSPAVPRERSGRAGRVPLPRASRGAIAVWLLALLVALVATIQIRSQAEVERTLTGTDTTSLAFLIDDLHRANDALQAQTQDLARQQAMLQTGGSTAADQELTDEATRLRALEGLLPVHGPGVVMVIEASGLQALDLQDALNNLAAGGAEAIAVDDRRVVVGVSIQQGGAETMIDGIPVPSPWTISAIGDANRLAETASLMTQQLQTDSRVRRATYRVEADLVIRATAVPRPFVYGT